MTQWHPLFAELLRPLVQGHYEVRTDVPVGDVPRHADLLLLRRTSAGAPPFQGLWRWLTAWNVLEFKGPSVSARVADLDRLVELGLGIDRRLGEERRRQRQAGLPRGEVSYWYLANHLGRRFLREARDLLGRLEALGPGVWRVRHLGRWLVLVSSRTVPVERDSVPLHLLVREPLQTTRAVAEEVATQPDLWPVYAKWIAALFPRLWEEVREMARRSGQGPVLDLRPLIEHLGLDEVIRQIGLKRVIEEMGPKKVLEEMGPKKVLEEMGPKKVLEEMGLGWLLADLTPAQRRELLRRLGEQSKARG